MNYSALVSDPLVRAALDTIARYEVPQSRRIEDQYLTKYGGRVVGSFAGKDRTVVNAGGHSSSAHGRYQFLNGTWDEQLAWLASRGVLIMDFSPQSQDIVALSLIADKRKALAPILKGDMIGSLDALSWEWASLPDSRGRFRYGGQSGPWGPTEVQAYFVERARQHGYLGFSSTPIKPAPTGPLDVVPGGKPHVPSRPVDPSTPAGCAAPVSAVASLILALIWFL